MAVIADYTTTSGGDAFTLHIWYDDAVGDRQVHAEASGHGFDLCVVQATASIQRSIASYPSAGAVPQNPDLAARMAAADFTLIMNDGPQALQAVPPAQVRRIVGKAGSAGGVEVVNDEWSRA